MKKKKMKNVGLALAISAFLMGIVPANSALAYKAQDNIQNKVQDDAKNVSHIVADAPIPWITADAAIVVDAETGETVYEKNADEIMYPASMTKIMTAILVLENGDPGNVVIVSDYAADVECTRLYGGEKIREYDLIRGMLMVSDNGAATALAEHIGGSEQGFSDMMNEKAKEIGMTSSHFVNANGMPDYDHYSTARDMVKLAQYAMKNATFRRIVASKEYNMVFVDPADRTEFVENSNELLYDYPGTIGIKTGWTSSAGGCLASAVQRKGHELIAIVMHSDDTEARFSDSRKLFNYGFQRLSDVSCDPIFR